MFFVLCWTWCQPSFEFNRQCFGPTVLCSELDLVFSVMKSRRALILVGLSVICSRLDLVGIVLVLVFIAFSWT